MKDDDDRLLYAGLPVVVTFTLFLAYFQTPELPRFMLDLKSHLLPNPMQAQTKLRDEVYPVLVEQKYRPDPKTRQIRALSDVTTEGTGGITYDPGFHTLTPYDTLTSGSTGRNANSSDSSSNSEKPGDLGQKSGAQISAQAGRGEERDMKIPMNYRFREDFALRYDDSPRLSIARQELAGFRYFQSMLRQIKENFSAPGYNYAYRDQAGTVKSQPIKPQVVSVLFMLDSDGYVRDVRKTSSLGQKAVDDACINVLKGQNFGPPPPEIFSNGNIFGINFIFPPVWNQ